MSAWEIVLPVAPWIVTIGNVAFFCSLGMMSREAVLEARDIRREKGNRQE
jgi:hypothetical protein